MEHMTLHEIATDLLAAMRDGQQHVGYRMDLWNALDAALRTPPAVEPDMTDDEGSDIPGEYMGLHGEQKAAVEPDEGLVAFVMAQIPEAYAEIKAQLPDAVICYGEAQGCVREEGCEESCLMLATYRKGAEFAARATPSIRAQPIEETATYPVPDGQTPLNDKLGHRYLDVIKEGSDARDTGSYSPYHGHSLEHCLHATGWVQRDLRLALDAALRAVKGGQGA